MREGPAGALMGRVIPLGLACLAILLAAATPARAAFGFDSVESFFTGPGGETVPTLAAGSHPELWTATVAFNTVDAPGEARPDGALRDLSIELPAGMIGAPTLLPKCARGDFYYESCPAATAVGVFRVEVSPGTWLEEPAYLLEPPPGVAALLGFHAGGLPITVDIAIAPSPPHNLIARLTNVSQAAQIFAMTLTLEGAPGDSAFLTLPRRCAPALPTGFAASSWPPAQPAVAAVAPEPPALADCQSLPYSPELRVAPTSAEAASPSGLDLVLDAPDPGIAAADGRAAADTGSVRLVLPPGLTVNPPVAAGLASCGPADLASERPDRDSSTGCPEAAKIGSASVVTPLLDEPIAGDVYVARPDDPATSAPGAENPFDSFLALYLVLRDPERGVLLSLPIRIDADPGSGRLVAEVSEIPELPLSRLALRFNSGPRAPLSTPTGCGDHQISYSLRPSSGNPPLEGESRFATTSECDPPFAPSLSAGTTGTGAGSAATLALQLGNREGAPNFSDLRLALPPGLAADLTAAATCPEGLAATAACPASSRLGFARIALGAGPEPLWVPAGAASDSDVYLAGPYRGAAFSLLVTLSAGVGPFDLGRVVLRAPVRIDPETARISVELSDLPQIRAGIPLRYRAIRLVLDRPGFIRNPTACQARRIELAGIAAGGATAEASTPFRATGCGGLRFRPRLSVRLAGGLGRNGHPGVHLRLGSRPGEANLGAASFDLPAGELLDLRRIRALCTRDLAPARCPAASRLGWATLRSPLLREPLHGQIFLRAPAGRYPDLLAEVSGGGVRLVLHGRAASARGGRLRIQLDRLPDIPLSTASIVLAGGRRGIVVNSADLCDRRPPRAFARLAAQNGSERRLAPRLRLRGRC